MAINSISPFFIVRNVPRAIAFYRDALGFAVTYIVPGPDPFFAIVGRDGGQIFLKSAGIDPQPNVQRHPWVKWDAYAFASDPDALAAEFAVRGVTPSAPLADTEDGLRGFEITDPDGYALFFGRPR